MPESDLHGATLIVSAGLDAIPHGSILAHRTTSRFAYIRGMEPKSHGTQRRIEGGRLPVGDTAYVVFGYDMTLAQAIEVLAEAGVEVVGNQQVFFKESNHEPATWYV